MTNLAADAWETRALRAIPQEEWEDAIQQLMAEDPELEYHAAASIALRQWWEAHEQPTTRKPRLDSVCAGVLAEVRRRGWTPGLTEATYEAIVHAGFRRKTLPLAFVATEVLCLEQPNTLRQLFYRLVSLGWLPSTDREHYQRLSRLMADLREAGIVPFA